MIAVAASERARSVVAEFFELFKTPWELYGPDSKPDVLLCCGVHLLDTPARLVLLYDGGGQTVDGENSVSISSEGHGTVLRDGFTRVPIYGKYITFEGSHALIDERSGKPSAWQRSSGAQIIVRLGFDLFEEIRHLLTHGQPPDHAHHPAVELHIEMLRQLIVGCSIPFVEIPPVPPGYSVIACLTHDVDHVGVRNHKWDHTMFGFIYRATIGSVIDFCRGRRSLKHLGINCLAALSLPFVHLGLAKDFWVVFDRYLEIEKGVTSTFFVIPTKGDPGQGANGPRAPRRAARYAASEIQVYLERIVAAGHEVAVHGIDAWQDALKGRAEFDSVQRITNAAQVGVRMHWLFFNQQSPSTLEKAGFAYDSTVGYNETVGYRAGTTQVYKPLDVARLLELPMHIMDTALFYPAYMDLAPEEARVVVGELVQNAVRFGGVLTINWHDRSIAPERLWDDAYIALLKDLQGKCAWFATAGDAVGWFRKRRSAVIENVAGEGNEVRVKVSFDASDDNLPGLTLRVYGGTQPTNSSIADRGKFTETSLTQSGEVQVSLA